MGAYPWPIKAGSGTKTHIPGMPPTCPRFKVRMLTSGWVSEGGEAMMRHAYYTKDQPYLVQGVIPNNAVSFLEEPTGTFACTSTSTNTRSSTKTQWGVLLK